MKKKVTQQTQVKSKEFDVLFAYGDRHVPHQDRVLERILLEMITDVHPNIVLDGGDFLSADSLSSFVKDHDQMVGLQGELDEDYEWRKKINTIVPDAWKVVLRDNHFFRRLEDRKKESIWMTDLRNLQADTLLRLGELKWDLLTEWKWRNKVLFIHGDDKSHDLSPASARNPVNKVRNIARDYGLSVVRFHTHVTGIEAYRRLGEMQYAVQLGTFQDLQNTGYIKHKDLVNWTHSAAVFYLSKDTTELHVNPIMFSGRAAFLNGKYYC